MPAAGRRHIHIVVESVDNLRVVCNFESILVSPDEPEIVVPRRLAERPNGTLPVLLQRQGHIEPVRKLQVTALSIESANVWPAHVHNLDIGVSRQRPAARTRCEKSNVRL